MADPVERFRRDVTTTLGRAIGRHDVLAIAVSGGPDSMALLALAATCWPGQVIAATVDHGLRAEAADEAAMVAAWYARQIVEEAQSPSSSQRGLGSHSASAGQEPLETPACAGVTGGPGQLCSRSKERVPHATLTLSAPLGTANLQASARTARYALLADWARGQGATILATAHHADDQAETFLMRAARGSGLAGLASIRPRRRLDQDITLIRPLLGWRRADLRALAENWALPFVDDPSNASARHDRTRFRALLAETPLLDPAQLARAAGYLLEADRDLRAIEAWLLDSRALPADPDTVALDVTALPRDLRRRLARSAIAKLREGGAITESTFSSATNIEPLLDALAEGKSATQAGVMVSVRGEIWHFRRQPPRRGT